MGALKKSLSLGISLVALVITAYSFTRVQDIRDWLILRNYTPSAEIESIARATQLNDYGEKLFYVHDPKLETAESFNKDCVIAESSIVLGCYNGVNIFIYDVKDERLDGIHEVTAVHEMLHAAYDRLSKSEKERVDTLTTKQLAKLSSERIQKVIKQYRARDPAIVPNELHSVLGSEVRNLEPELEAYYSQYFIDRSAVVTLSEKYEQVFTKNENDREALGATLSLNKARLASYEQELSDKADDIRDHRVRLDGLLAAGNTTEYNNQVPAYNAKVKDYNNELTDYKTLLRDTNDVIVQYNSLVIYQNELIQSIDSRASEL